MRLVSEKADDVSSGDACRPSESVFVIPRTLLAREGVAAPEPGAVGTGAAESHIRATFWISAIARSTRACESDSGGVLRSRSRSISPYRGMRCVGMIAMSIGVKHLAAAPAGCAA